MNRRQFVLEVSMAGTTMRLAPSLTSANSFYEGSPNSKVVLALIGAEIRSIDWSHPQ